MGIPVKIESKYNEPIRATFRGHYCSFECVAGYLFYLSPCLDHYTNLKFLWEKSYPDKELRLIPPQEAVGSLTAEELELVEKHKLICIPGISIYREYLTFRIESPINLQ